MVYYIIDFFSLFFFALRFLFINIDIQFENEELNLEAVFIVFESNVVLYIFFVME